MTPEIFAETLRQQGDRAEGTESTPKPGAGAAAPAEATGVRELAREPVFRRAEAGTDATAIPSRMDLRLALALGAGDVAFMLLNVALVIGWLQDPRFSVGYEGGYAEWFQYGKELAIVVLVGALAARRRSVLLAQLSVLFLYFLIDDSMSVHESLGKALGSRYPLPHALRELAVHAVIGTTFLVAIGLGCRRSDDGSKRITRWLLAGVVALGFFGGVIDAAADVVQRFASLHTAGVLLGYADDCGEMVVMSAILTFAAGLGAFARRTPAAARPSPE